MQAESSGKQQERVAGSAYSASQRAPYLHTELIKDKTGCVVKETVSFPVELHGPVFVVMSYCIGETNRAVSEKPPYDRLETIHSREKSKPFIQGGVPDSKGPFSTL